MMLEDRKFYPSVFRIAIGFLLLVDSIGGILYSADLYQLKGYNYSYDAHWPILEHLRAHIDVFLTAYIMVLVLWIVGIGKQITTLLVFIFYIIDFYLLHAALFWGDYVLKMSLLFFVWVDAFHFFALKPERPKAGMIHKLAVLSIMLNVCLVYWDNALYKFENPEWMSGYAIAYFFAFSRPLDIFGIGDWMMQYPLLIKSATWGVLIFQITFPVVLWIKRLKYGWIVVGILIHLLMAVTLQLYKFELIMILLYGFFVTDTEWQGIFDKLNIKLDIIHGKR